MDAIHKARELYLNKFQQENQSSSLNIDIQKLDDDIHRYISIAVKSIPSASNLFNNSCIFDSLINALLTCVTNEGVKPVANAYKYLEKYFFLLVQQPWKPEYRTLKMYGGFYKTKIKSILWQAEYIFMSAGYDEDSDNTLVYRKSNVNKQQLLILSFDCFVAYEICERIVERHNQLKTVGKTLDDAISDLLQKSWPQDRATNKSSFEMIDPPALPKREPMHNGSNNTKTVIYSVEPSPVYDVSIQSQDPEQYLGNFKYKSHIPYMDEAEHYPKLSKGTVEDHMRKSMKLVNEQQDSPEWKNHRDAFFKSSNPDSTITCPPGNYPHNTLYPLGTTDCYKAEGINTDISVPPKSTIGMPVSYAFSKGVISDQGYGTGSTNSSPMYILSGQEMLSDTIYRPPAINSEMNIASLIPMTKNHVIPPPPVPSRNLKPSIKSVGSDMVDGHVTVKYNGNDTVIQPNKVAIPSSSDNTPLPIGSLNIGNDLLSRRSLHQLRSGSSKAEAKKPFYDNRATKSFDGIYDRWKCPRCECLNSSLTAKCLQCAFTQIGGSTEPPSEVSGEPKKSCLACTYDNDWRLINCGICGELLP